MQRAVDAFAEKDMIDVVVALEQFHLRDLRQSPRDVFRRCSGVHAINTENADVELSLSCPSHIDGKKLRFATCAADGGQAHAIEVFDHHGSAGFDFHCRLNREFGGESTNAGLIHAARRRIDSKCLDRAAVEIGFVIGGLQQHRIIRRGMIEFFPGERMPIV